MLIRTIVNAISTVAIFLAIVGMFYNVTPWWCILIVLLIWFLITAYGVVNIRSGYFLKSLSSNPLIKEKKIAITFDDGPSHNTLEILAVLQKFKVKGTFFCIGKQVEQYPDVTKKTIALGHVIGNHTYSHSQFIDVYSTEKFISEIERADAIIKKVSEKKTLLFRPPYGVTNPNIASAVEKTGHAVIGWNKRSFDTTIPSEKVVLKRITKNLKGGDVILLHDTKKITVTVLEQLLLFLERNKYTTVTIDELFSIQPYA